MPQSPAIIPKARIAPTPSGYLHQGNLANFLVNKRLAGDSGQLLLRIDDLDKPRTRLPYLHDIFRVVEALGIRITEGPSTIDEYMDRWTQDNRLPRYGQVLERLTKSDAVFACPCSRKDLADGEHRYDCLVNRLPLMTPEAAWRIDTSRFGPVVIPDLTGRTFTVDAHASIPEFVVRNKAGRPSYQLACVVDDLDFGITQVGRGRDLLASTAAQAILSDLLGFPALFERIDFLHHPLLLGVDGEKLSKSAGKQSEPLPITKKLFNSLLQSVDAWMA